MCHSKLIPRDIKGAVEDAEDVDVSIILHGVCDPIVSIEQDSDVTRGSREAVSDLGKTGEDLRPLIDFLNGASGGVGAICGDVLEDVLEPALSLCGPRYCGHERMRCAICSFEMVRFASESASPRSTMT
jgi:hypothetical protein